MSKKFKYFSVEPSEQVEWNDDGTVNERRVIELFPSTGTQIAKELDDALAIICQGIEIDELSDAWVNIDKGRKGKPKLSFCLKFWVKRPMTKEELKEFDKEREEENAKDKAYDLQRARRQMKQLLKEHPELRNELK